MQLRKYILNNFMSRLSKILNFKTSIRSEVKINKILNSIITNKYIKSNGFTLSNYGIWMLDNYIDKTFRFSIIGYRNNLEKILLSISDPHIFIDVGANQGVFSMIAAKNKNFTEIHAFEPNINIISYLEKNFIVNKVNNFFIHEVAIGPQSTSLSFFVPENHSGNGRISSHNSNMQVICINRDYLNKVFTQSVGSYFIKIDVEGSESDVLNELFNSNMSLLIKYIFIEINTRFSDEDMIINILQGNGFYEKFRRGNKVSYDALYVR
jgi:FkbM family methyltransferase